MKKYIGIDLGGTSIKYGLVDETGELSKVNQFSTPKNKTDLLTKLSLIIHEYQQNFNIEGIGISVPGVVQADGFLTTAGAIQCLYGINLKTTLEELVNIPVQIENDANAAAIAEKWLGNAQGIHNYLTLVLGTGVGGAIVINDQIYRGSHARSGEFGWMIIENDDIDIEMGSLNFRGATVIGLIRRYNQFSSDPVDDARLIFKRAKENETLAQNILTSFYHSLAKGIINLIVSFDPEMVVIGGGISANELFIKELISTIESIKNNHNSIDNLDFPPVIAAKLGNNAGIIGAVYQLINR